MNWLLLRGLARESGHWGEFPQRLEAVVGEGKVHTPDLPGTGVRYREPSPATVAGIRAAVQEAVRHIEPPYGIVGLSLGGMVALDWAQQATEGTVQHLVLINTSTGFSHPWQRLRVPAWGKMLRLMVTRDLYQREAATLALSANRPADAELIHTWYQIQRRHPVSRRNVLHQLRAAARYRPQPRPPLTTPLLLASRTDRLVDWHCSADLERRWQWPLQLHDSAGHDLPLDDQDWVLGHIANNVTKIN